MRQYGGSRDSGLRRVLGELAGFARTTIGILLFPFYLARSTTPKAVQLVVLGGVLTMAVVVVLFPPLALLSALLLFVLGGTVGAMSVQKHHVETVTRKN
ncbi:hypothetical protein [Haloarchaeobius sp. TZWWS8]|uniref:hypothetical protein n=1 Tax=Haloarchaeobius sp. TZWWS8 TaxID=3446121 RepID=UPI003EB9E7DE